MRRLSTATSSSVKLLLFCFTFFLFVCTPVFALTAPAPQGFVTDLAELYTPEEQLDLESFLISVNENQTTEIAVLTIPSLQGDSLEEFATRTFREWGIGNEATDNGVLLLIVEDERAVRIEVGYGLEGAITDLDSGRIIRNIITPAFREGDYYVGTKAALETLAAYAGEDPSARAERDNEQKSGIGWGFGISVAYLLLAIATVGLFTKKAGAAFGIRFAGYLVAILVAVVISMIAFQIVSVVCMFILMAFSKGKSNWGGPGMGGFGGGGFGGGSSGGFGGFGGGSSGGGGASGRW